ncbi:MAG: hypothetical protein ABIO70_00640, partial [Pseudomonadota bacterium]
ALLALLGLYLPADLDPLRASHGQRLALAIAAVLAPLPPVLLLDDPAAWLDPAGEERLFATLDHLQAAHGLAVVVASHDQDLLARTCGRLVVLPASRPVRRDTSTGPGPRARSDAGVVAVLAAGLAVIAGVAVLRDLAPLWGLVGALLVGLRLAPGGRRSLPRVLRRGALLLGTSTLVLGVLQGWPAGLGLGLLTVGKALGAWLPATIALRSLRRADLQRLLCRLAGPRLGLAMALCIAAGPLIERAAARAWEQARLRRIRNPAAVLLPVVLRIFSLASAQADAATLRAAGTGPLGGQELT